MILYQEPTENDKEAWTVAVGNLPWCYPWLPFLMKRGAKEAIKLIRAQEGFLGFYLNKPYGTLCLFDSENHAKGARNILRYHKAQVGDNICKVWIKGE